MYGDGHSTTLRPELFLDRMSVFCVSGNSIRACSSGTIRSKIDLLRKRIGLVVQVIHPVVTTWHRIH